MKKKVLAGMLLALAVCSVTACGKDKNKEEVPASGSVVTSEASQAGSQTPEVSQTQETAQTGEQAGQTAQTGEQPGQTTQTAQDGLQMPETAQTGDTAQGALQMPETAQTTDTAQQNQTAGAQPAPAGISLEEDMSSVSYVLLARMISEQEGNKAYDAAAKANGDSFWKEMDLLVSAYGVNNKKIDFNESTKEYSMKKAQLRYYAAALYSDLGKAKKLPTIESDSTSVTKKGSKWKFAMNDTSAYDISIQSCAKQEKNGTYELRMHLVDSATQTSLGEYTALIKKSPYKSSKSPFHYSVVSLNKMTKMNMETVLVGDRKDETEDTSQTGTTAGTQTAGTQDVQTQTTGTSATDGTTQQYGQVLTMPGTSSGTTTAPQTTENAPASQTQTQTTDPAAGQTAPAQSGTVDIAGATITAEAAMEIAKKYYGAAAADGTGYTYKYEGTTTYQNVPYYNFSVTNGETLVINVLVSGDGARIYKGTNTNNSWTMQ